MKLTKTGSFVHKTKGTRNCRKFCYIAKIRYSSEILGVAKIPAAPVQFLHSCLDAIEDKSLELDVNQLNFDMPSLT